MPHPALRPAAVAKRSSVFVRDFLSLSLSLSQCSFLTLQFVEPRKDTARPSRIGQSEALAAGGSRCSWERAAFACEPPEFGAHSYVLIGSSRDEKRQQGKQAPREPFPPLLPLTATALVGLPAPRRVYLWCGTRVTCGAKTRTHIPLYRCSVRYSSERLFMLLKKFSNYKETQF